MSWFTEEIRQEAKQEGIEEERKNNIINMLKANKYDLEEIAGILKVSVEEVKRLQAELHMKSE